MCGIAGFVGPRPLSPERFRAASDALYHRGPDATNFIQFPLRHIHAGLLHRRLAIIDLEPRSNQPFHFGNTTLVFNGEIYNYLEVRSTLKTLGHVFETNGDTEVLAHALEQWGLAALDRLEGMWAFAWHDKSRETITLVRDRFGEKPLYLWRKDGYVFFASEPKGMFALAAQKPRVNTNHILRYMVNGYKSIYKTKETFFAGIEEVPSGSYIELPCQSVNFRKYWTPETAIDETMTYERAVEATRESLIRSVKIRLRSDVPLGFCMSGGIDSNALISIAAKHFQYEVHGFTISNRDERYAEESMVQANVEHLGIQHTSISLDTTDFLKNLKNLVAVHDAPVYTISYYTHWMLMRSMANHNYRVAISGTGADELFSGYYDHHNLYLYEMSKGQSGFEHALNQWTEHQLPIVRNPFLRDSHVFIKDPSFRKHIFLHNDIFGDWVKGGWEESFHETDFGLPLMRNRMMNELFHESVPVILHEDDSNAMYYSIENRSPFLDRSLCELAYSIPTRHLVQNGRAKSVLRDALSGLVPDTILENRRKVGFNAPITDLLNTKSQRVREYLLDDSPIFDLIKKDAVEGLIDKQEPLPNSMSKFLFYFLTSKIFLEQNSEESAYG